jgi:hypothetical protein
LAPTTVKVLAGAGATTVTVFCGGGAAGGEATRGVVTLTAGVMVMIVGDKVTTEVDAEAVTVTGGGVLVIVVGVFEMVVAADVTEEVGVEVV